ncbi:hypothetical protein DA2_0703 [Desulfovibrio sp. A2]|nr:hypothetical protein DA2_0703 [Desulfovibrio sp. A2]
MIQHNYRCPAAAGGASPAGTAFPARAAQARRAVILSVNEAKVDVTLAAMDRVEE